MGEKSIQIWPAPANLGESTYLFSTFLTPTWKRDVIFGTKLFDCANIALFSRYVRKSIRCNISEADVIMRTGDIFRNVFMWCTKHIFIFVLLSLHQ